MNSESESEHDPAVDARQQLLELNDIYIVSRALHTAAYLAIADAIGEEARMIADVGRQIEANPDALKRLLRLLASYGIFDLSGEFVAHTLASRMMRTDHPESLRGNILLAGLPVTWRSAEYLDHCVRTGMAGATEAFPQGYWQEIERRPELGEILNAGMVARARTTVPTIVRSYDFRPYAVIGDIGGGMGHLLEAILGAAPGAQGVLFDLPEVIAQTTPTERITAQAGNFLTDSLPACDLYILKDIIHDWPDSESVAILHNIRSAAPAGARLLLCEMLVPDHQKPDISKIVDITMLANFGAKQRTLQEYEDLFQETGFTLEREIDTGAGFTIIEAVAT